MVSRDDLIGDFIQRSGWGDAAVAPLAGDASNRRYLRLNHPDLGPAVLMDAPPEKGEDTRPFLHIARHLLAIGLSAPRILAEDQAAGLLLIEDLGDDLFARVTNADPTQEVPLYEAATDALLHLHRADLPTGLAAYNPQVMTDMAALGFDWYLSHALGPDETARDAFMSAFRPLLDTYVPDQTVLIQRDYHAENLIWLPERDGVARVGLLDFQDAMTGHPAYDLMSLLQDARRDVAPRTEAAMIARYTTAAGLDPERFKTAYAILGAQRNLRIIGVFARLCIRDGKAHYVDLIPRVWDLLQRDLCHPALAPIRPLVSVLPDPTAATLSRLKSQCPAP